MTAGDPGDGLIRTPAGRYFCRVVLPWFSFRRGARPVDQIRRLAYFSYRQATRRRVPLRTLRSALSWPLFATQRAADAVRSLGPLVAANGGPGMWRQFSDLVSLGVGRNVTTKSYYLFRLWEPGRHDQADLYIQDFEGRWILSAINAGKDLAAIDDKVRFAEFCSRHDLPTVPIVARFGPGSAEHWAGAGSTLPPADLFVKRSGAKAVAGAGAECWLFDATAQAWRRGADQCDQTALLERLRRAGSSEQLILQRRVINHPGIAGLSRRALCTVRAVTVRLPGRPAAHFRSCLRMPFGDADVDHPVHGGLASAVHAGGILGPAVGNRVGPAYTRHPSTGAPVEGCRIPFFPEAIGLALRAHDALGIDSAIGWDIALTPAGAVLLEGNSEWGTDVMQTSFGEPLGATTILADLLTLLAATGPRARPSH